MPTFNVNIAMDIRAYGVVTIDADSPDDLEQLLTAEYVAENFEPHGSGSDDYDFSHPRDIWADSCEDLDSGEDVVLEIDVANGEWVK